MAELVRAGEAGLMYAIVFKALLEDGLWNVGRVGFLEDVNSSLDPLDDAPGVLEILLDVRALLENLVLDGGLVHSGLLEA